MARPNIKTASNVVFWFSLLRYFSSFSKDKSTHEVQQNKFNLYLYQPPLPLHVSFHFLFQSYNEVRYQEYTQIIHWHNVQIKIHHGPPT